MKTPPAVIRRNRRAILNSTRKVTLARYYDASAHKILRPGPPKPSSFPADYEAFYTRETFNDYDRRMQNEAD